MSTLSSTLAERFPDMTPSQRRIARHVFHQVNHVLVATQAQLAEQVGVSEATVSRFMHTLGFSRFKDFKDALTKEAFAEFSTTRRLVDSSDRLQGTVMSSVLSTDIANIREILSTQSDEHFEQAVQSLAQARNVYVLGLRSSYTLAFYLYFTLRFFSSNVRLLRPDVGDMPEQILDIGADDVLVGISFRRYTQLTIDLTKKIKKKGTTVVAITDSMLSPLAHLADITMLTATSMPSFFESYTAPMSLINALMAALALSREDQAIYALDLMESTLEDFETYFQD
ncbi:MAG: MurR/RpiR family transcriptional regulator [Desulfovermiculus sp.]|nr:MurR/RpiR family transcriptional regulator [Desulfovermiculus sp.]